jgi:citrate synthase
MHADPEYLSAPEAIAFLDVKRATLYTYVSRGWIKTLPDPKGRGNLYLKADLAKLKARHDARAGHAAVASAALRWGEPLLDTSLTEITPQGPRVRGHLLVELAQADASLEAVAELLWLGQLPKTPPVWPTPDEPPPLSWLAQRLQGASPMQALQWAAPALAMPDLDDEARALAHARRLLRGMAAISGLGYGAANPTAAWEAPPSALGVAQALGMALGGPAWPSAERLRALNRGLVVCADHELNASTFAARVAAGAGASLGACVGAGLATLSGHRHGGVCASVEGLLRQAQELGARQAVARYVGHKATPPGFGHALYPDGDPRWPVLWQTARDLAPADPTLALAQELAQEAAERLGERPTLDLGLVCLAVALKLGPGAAEAIFAVGRAAGWVAHAREQRASPWLLRPRARYVPEPRPASSRTSKK